MYIGAKLYIYMRTKKIHAIPCFLLHVVAAKFGAMNLAEHDMLRPGSYAYFQCRSYFLGLQRAS